MLELTPAAEKYVEAVTAFLQVFGSPTATEVQKQYALRILDVTKRALDAACVSAHGTLDRQGCLVPVRRRLPIDHELFEQGNLEREELAYIESLQGTAERLELIGLQQIDTLLLESLHTFRCSVCHVSLPSGHLLDLHMAEAHDSFFAAQAAKRMRVYRCLVEGCSKAFSSIMDRRRHLVDGHAFASNLAYDRMHLCKRQAQHRPLQQFQKAAPKREPPRKTGTQARNKTDSNPLSLGGDKPQQTWPGPDKNAPSATALPPEGQWPPQPRPHDAMPARPQLWHKATPVGASGAAEMQPHPGSSFQSSGTQSAKVSEVPVESPPGGPLEQGSAMEIDRLADRLSRLRTSSRQPRSQHQPHVHGRGRRVAL